MGERKFNKGVIKPSYSFKYSPKEKDDLKLYVAFTRCRQVRKNKHGKREWAGKYSIEDWENRNCPKCKAQNWNLVAYDDGTEPVVVMHCNHCDSDFCLLCRGIMSRDLRNLPILANYSFAQARVMLGE